MDFNIIINLFKFIVVIVSIFVVLYTIIVPYLKEKNNIRVFELENYKMDLFMKIDPKFAETQIEELIKKYINDYVVVNFLIHDVDYIRKEEIENMLKSVYQKILVELSELYIFYIKIIVNIQNEEDLAMYIRKKTKDQILEFVTEFNKPRE